MCPQARLLIMQPQICLANCIGAHLLTNLLVFAVLVFDTTVCNRVDNVYALLAELSCKGLCQLPDRSTTSAIRRELRAAPECTERAGEDERLANVSLWRQSMGRQEVTYSLLISTIRQRLLPMISIEPLNALLCKCKSTTNIVLQTTLELLPRLLQKRLLRRVLDTVHRDLGFQTREALVRFDVLEGLFDRCFGRI